MSAVTIDPRTQGSVEDFSIENISPETRTPLTFKPLFEAEAKAARRREGVPQDEDRISERQHQGDRGSAEARSAARREVHAAQQKTKEEWDKWREGIAAHARTTSAATAAIKRATGVAEASLTQPGQPALDPRTFEGETIKKDVTVKASVKIAGRRDVGEDAGDHDRARRRRRPRRPADYYEDHGTMRPVEREVFRSATRA